MCGREPSPFFFDAPCQPSTTTSTMDLGVESTYSDAQLQSVASKALRVLLTSPAAPSHAQLRGAVLGGDDGHAR